MHIRQAFWDIYVYVYSGQDGELVEDHSRGELDFDGTRQSPSALSNGDLRPLQKVLLRGTVSIFLDPGSRAYRN
jgi:hypothetical protein